MAPTNQTLTSPSGQKTSVHGDEHNPRGILKNEAGQQKKVAVVQKGLQLLGPRAVYNKPSSRKRKGVKMDKADPRKKGPPAKGVQPT